MALMRRLTVLAGAAEAARRYVRNNPDKVNKFADKAGRFVDQKTKGKYHRQIDNAVRKVRASTTNHKGYRHH
jgi:hypothetical protein